tara:strand:- start:1801 stop:2499 length:699 start_codon:yes stop_codon:yes gene_type:complete
MNSKILKKNWKKNNSYEKKYGANNPPSYPNEMLVRLCSSTRFSDIKINLSKKNLKILEIGCFAGNNLRFFLEKKIQCFGSEINSSMKRLCENNLKSLGYKNLKIKIGDNENINFKSYFFDLLISINTIHYSYGKNLENAVKEYSRVLKKNGVLLFETPSPEHSTMKKSKKISDFHFLWGDNGFRKKTPIGFINNLNKFKKILYKYFSKIEINHKVEKYKNMNLSTYFFICQK